jgi:hypothetical protein
MMSDDTSDENRELPMVTAISLTRIQLQRHRGELSDRDAWDAIKLELAACDDPRLLAEAQAELTTGVLQTL